MLLKIKYKIKTKPVATFKFGIECSCIASSSISAQPTKFVSHPQQHNKMAQLFPYSLA